jgi:hypothetical protein
LRQLTKLIERSALEAIPAGASPSLGITIHCATKTTLRPRTDGQE